MDKVITNSFKNLTGTTIITEGSSISGKLIIQGSDLHINGKVSASLFCDGDVFIASSGVFLGEYIIARNLKIAGYIKTNIQSKGVHIAKTGFAIANILCKTIDIAYGADVESCFLTTNTDIDLDSLLAKIVNNKI